MNEFPEHLLKMHEQVRRRNLETTLKTKLWIRKYIQKRGQDKTVMQVIKIIRPITTKSLEEKSGEKSSGPYRDWN